MARFVIEVAQAEGTLATRRIRHAGKGIGSHFVTRAAWRRRRGLCVGRMTLEADNAAQAFGVVPPSLRPYACVREAETALAA